MHFKSGKRCTTLNSQWSSLVASLQSTSRPKLPPGPSKALLRPFWRAIRPYFSLFGWITKARGGNQQIISAKWGKEKNAGGGNRGAVFRLFFTHFSLPRTSFDYFTFRSYIGPRLAHTPWDDGGKAREYDNINGDEDFRFRFLFLTSKLQTMDSDWLYRALAISNSYFLFPI